jgi:hypothetical protein
MPSNPPPPCEFSVQKKLASAAPSKPGMTDERINRQTASTPSVNKIRDFSSGILKQLRTC